MSERLRAVDSNLEITGAEVADEAGWHRHTDGTVSTEASTATTKFHGLRRDDFNLDPEGTGPCHAFRYMPDPGRVYGRGERPAPWVGEWFSWCPEHGHIGSGHGGWCSTPELAVHRACVHNTRYHQVPRCSACDGPLGEATGVCQDCGHDQMGYYDHNCPCSTCTDPERTDQP